mmetsp:Transcript_65065/g.190361  ORF Transcript_65065/g.190361 Transcript_65065/m.190361 type:complete len:283 (-) Transcript_65065:265-1113(-)
MRGSATSCCEYNDLLLQLLFWLLLRLELRQLLLLLLLLLLWLLLCLLLRLRQLLLRLQIQCSSQSSTLSDLLAIWILLCQPPLLLSGLLLGKSLLCRPRLTLLFRLCLLPSSEVLLRLQLLLLPRSRRQTQLLPFGLLRSWEVPMQLLVLLSQRALRQPLQLPLTLPRLRLFWRRLPGFHAAHMRRRRNGLDVVALRRRRRHQRCTAPWTVGSALQCRLSEAPRKFHPQRLVDTALLAQGLPEGLLMPCRRDQHTSSLVHWRGESHERPSARATGKRLFSTV